MNIKSAICGSAAALAAFFFIDLTRGEMGLGRPGFVDGSTAALWTKEEEKVCARQAYNDNGWISLWEKKNKKNGNQ